MLQTPKLHRCQMFIRAWRELSENGRGNTMFFRLYNREGASKNTIKRVSVNALGTVNDFTVGYTDTIDTACQFNNKLSMYS